MNEWMENGCGLIDAGEEVVYIYHNQTETVHKGFDTPPSGEPVLPGFTLVLSELRV
jgi:hypothetical protein